MPIPRDEYDCPKPTMTILFLFVGDDTARDGTIILVKPMKRETYWKPLGKIFIF